MNKSALLAAMQNVKKTKRGWIILTHFDGNLIFKKGHRLMDLEFQLTKS